MSDFQFIAGGYELRAIPETCGRFYCQAVDGCRNDECKPCLLYTSHFARVIVAGKDSYMRVDMNIVRHCKFPSECERRVLYIMSHALRAVSYTHLNDDSCYIFYLGIS